MKIAYIIVLLSAATHTLCARTLELSGVFENSVTVNSNFPAGADYTLTVEYDENAEDLNATIPDTESYAYEPITSYTLDVPASGFSRTSSTITGTLNIAHAPEFGENSARLTLRDFFDGSFLNLRLEWVVNTPAKAALFASRDLTEADLSPAASDFIWLHIEGFPEVFAFSSIHSREPNGTPATFRASGFDEMFVFGDSLSGVDGTSPGNPLYYQSGYTNGPNWVQHLATAIGVPFRRDNVIAGFGGIAAYDPATFASMPSFRSLATWWDNSENFRAFIDANLFGELVSDDATILASEERVQRALLTFVNQADALGIGNVLLLAPVDFGFSPSGRQSFDTPEKRQSLTDLVTAINASLVIRAQSTARLYPGVAQRLIDPADFIDQVLLGPSDFGLTEVETAVISPSELGVPGEIIDDPSLDGPGADYFFWTGTAPTTCVHRILAEYVIDFAFPAFRTGARVEVLTARDDIIRVQTSRLDSGIFYRLERSTDLTTWSGFDFPTFGPARKFTFPREGKAKEYFRIFPTGF